MRSIRSPQNKMPLLTCFYITGNIFKDHVNYLSATFTENGVRDIEREWMIGVIVYLWMIGNIGFKREINISLILV